jgi:hypothetical protein
MELERTLLAILVTAIALLIAAEWARVPYPILLVLGGLALALVPGIPEFELEPDVVLLILLPPSLYAAAYRQRRFRARSPAGEFDGGFDGDGIRDPLGGLPAARPRAAGGTARRADRDARPGRDQTTRSCAASSASSTSRTRGSRSELRRTALLRRRGCKPSPMP